jgi:NADH:ubiquinone oxidoreductase subunit F (NADH-binding)
VVLADHLARHGQLPSCPRLIDMLRDAGLTGRDSSGRPAHATLADAAAARRAGGAPVVLARAELWEPASRKDTALLWMSPHLVLDGLQLAAAAAGAQRVRLCVGCQPGHRLRDSLRAAVADRAGAGLDVVPAEVDVAGHLAGAGPGAGTPAGQPVLEANVETLAHVALIARHGAAWFRTVGTAAEPGTMLCTIRQPDGQDDIVEAPIGAPVGELVGLGARTQAVLAGGYHGTWLPAARAASLPLSNAGLRQAQLRLPGASVGAGVLAALPDDRCGLAETSRVARYLASESRFGAARFVHLALGVFGEEVRLHERGRCRASSSSPFLPVPLPLRPVRPPPGPAPGTLKERFWAGHTDLSPAI